jgi:DHA2 family multidrug resistance protein
MMWVPVSALALGTLDKRLQAEGYAIFYLQFDIGSAVGVASVMAIHTSQTQATHAMLAEHVNPFNELFDYPAVTKIWDLAETSALAALDHEVTRQAAMIAYNNSFVLLAAGTAALIPTVFFFRPPKHRAGGH